MEVKDIEANKGNIDVVLEVVSLDEPRTFEKFGKEGRVCNAMVKDGSGSIKLTLWNDDVDKVKVGDKIHIENGWCSEYRDEKQLSTGKFGKLEVVGKAEGNATDDMMTNDPSILQPEVQETSTDSNVEEEMVE